MSAESIRVLVVDANPDVAGARPAWESEVSGIELVGVAHDRSAALAQIEELTPDVLVVDLMLPGLRSIDLIQQVVSSHPQVRILAESPDDPPHDRIMLATSAGALGFIQRHAPSADYGAAIERVHGGEPWLPRQPTYEVLKDGAAELDVSEKARRGRLTEVLLGLVPLTGLVAAVTASLWRHYYGSIGVRVADLGVDPTSRMIDVLVVFVMIIAIFGPLLFVRPRVKLIGQWVREHPESKWSKRLAKARSLPGGKLVFNFWVAWILGGLLVLSVTVALFQVIPLLMLLIVGPVVIITLVANVLELDDSFPNFLSLPHLDSWRVLGFFGIVLVVFLLAVGTEVLLLKPDMRPDGIHGIIAPKLLGFKAQPVMVYDLAEDKEPWGALFLGSQGDLYVVYDPCTEETSYLSVSSTASRIALIDEVDCGPP